MPAKVKGAPKCRSNQRHCHCPREMRIQGPQGKGWEHKLVSPLWTWTSVFELFGLGVPAPPNGLLSTPLLTSVTLTTFPVFFPSALGHKAYLGGLPPTTSCALPRQ